MKLTVKGDAVLLGLKVVPNASRTQIVGMLGEALKVKVALPPEGGKANRAVSAVLAEALGIAASQVTVVGGQTQARKVVAIRGLTAEEIEQRLASAAP